MDFKHALTFFGLLFDLVGATFLSIPMIWNTRLAAHLIIKIMKSVKVWLYGNANIRYSSQTASNSARAASITREVEEARHRTVGLMAFVGIVFGIVVVRLIYLFSFGSNNHTLFHSQFISFVAVIVSLPLIGVTLYYLNKLPLYLTRSLIWIARGNHERKIGFVGLGILCIGFVLQAIVNLM